MSLHVHMYAPPPKIWTLHICLSPKQNFETNPAVCVCVGVDCQKYRGSKYGGVMYRDSKWRSFYVEAF